MTLDFGADSQWSRFSTLYDPEVKARLSSGHALLGWQSEGLVLAAGARTDDHSRFGTHWTFGANGNLDLGEGWRIRASYGEGFKAPTLFQLLSNCGNAALRPERSKSYDAGIEHGDRNGPLHFALTAFRRDSRDLIGYDSCYLVSTGICTNRPYGTYDNVGSARAEGGEFEADARPSDRWTVHAAYSYVKATNRLTGRNLSRRPRHALSASADWRSPLHDLTLGADLRLVSDSFDNAFAARPLDGFAVLTLRAELPVSKSFTLYGRVENVTDAQYQTVAGYNAMARATYVGVRARY